MHEPPGRQDEGLIWAEALLSGAATCPPSLAAVQAEKERMKVEISSMLKSFEEQTYQIALGMA